MNAQDEFSLVLLPLRTLDRGNAGYYRKAAEFFETVWEGLYSKHHYSEKLYLDNLFRQDEAACIFHGEVCVGLILFRILDFSILDFSRDSYFTEWNATDLRTLLRHGTRAFLATYLSVHPDYRHFSPEFKFKEILLDVMVKRFKESPADVIAGITRKDRGIDEESYRLGATLIHENVDYMDGRFKVDLVGFYREEAKESQNPGARKFSDLIWSRRLDLTSTATPRLKVA